MTDETFGYHWKSLQSPLRKRWSLLSADDLAAINGRREVLVCLLRDRYLLTYRQAEEEADRFIEEWVPLVHPQPG